MEAPVNQMMIEIVNALAFVSFQILSQAIGVVLCILFPPSETSRYDGDPKVVTNLLDE